MIKGAFVGKCLASIAYNNISQSNLFIGESTMLKLVTNNPLLDENDNLSNDDNCFIIFKKNI